MYLFRSCIIKSENFLTFSLCVNTNTLEASCVEDSVLLLSSQSSGIKGHHITRWYSDNASPSGRWTCIQSRTLVIRQGNKTLPLVRNLVVKICLHGGVSIYRHDQFFEGKKSVTNLSRYVNKRGLELWWLTPLSTIFQLKVWKIL